MSHGIQIRGTEFLVRVLVISRQFPWPRDSGGSQRIFHFVRGLAKRHRVTLLALNRGVIPPEQLNDLQSASGCERIITFDGSDCMIWNDSLYWSTPTTFIRGLVASPFPVLVHDWWSKKLTEMLAQFFKEELFDLVVTRDPSFAEQARSVGFRRIVLDVDDLFSVLLSQEIHSLGWYWRRMLHRVDAAKARIYERSLPRRFERVVVAKLDDRRLFPTQLRNKIAVIPNGISLPATADRSLEEPDRLLFVGTLSYGPNVDAIRYLAREVLPLLWKQRPAVTLDVVGRSPADPEVLEALTDSRCRLHMSPPDLSPFYRKASLVVTPIRRGSGTRIKVLEALAYQKALVSTSFAPEGLGLQPGTHFVAADSAPEFARACNSLLGDSARRDALSKAGRAFVASHFDWDRIEETIGGLADAAFQQAESA